MKKKMLLVLFLIVATQSNGSSTDYTTWDQKYMDAQDRIYHEILKEIEQPTQAAFVFAVPQGKRLVAVLQGESPIMDVTGKTVAVLEKGRAFKEKLINKLLDEARVEGGYKQKAIDLINRKFGGVTLKLENK